MNAERASSAPSCSHCFGLRRVYRVAARRCRGPTRPVASGRTSCPSPRRPSSVCRELRSILSVAAVEVQVGPPQRAQFAAAAAGHHDQPQQQSPSRLLPGFVEDRCDLLGRRWVRVRLLEGRRHGEGGSVHRRCICQRTARSSAARRMKWTCRTVLLDSGSALVVRARARPPQRSRHFWSRAYKLLEQLGVQLGGLQAAEGRLDVVADELLVPTPRRRLVLGDLEPLLDGLRDSDALRGWRWSSTCLSSVGERLLRLLLGVGLLPQVRGRGRSAGRSPAYTTARNVAVGPLLDVAAGARLACSWRAA